MFGDTNILFFLRTWSMEDNMRRLQNKFALVTGAAQGIGAETARLFIEEGATVILTDIQDPAGEALAKSLGPQAHYHPLDVQKESAWIDVIGFIEKQWGQLDVLFNNAGVTGVNEHLGPQDPEHCSLESWQKVHHINLDSVFLGCKHGISLMKKKGGSIINMASRSGVVGIPGAAAYASSKAAIINHTRTVALHCAQHRYNIRCNALLPGAILTPLWDSMLGNTPEARERHIRAIAAGIPLGHMGEPIDVAYAALYLASEESRYMTGEFITLDGGILAGSTAAPGQKD